MARISYKDVKGSAISKLKSNNVSAVLCNPFYISIIIVIILLFIAHVEPVNLYKQGIYSFLITIAVILSHDVIIRDMYKDKNNSNERDIFKETVVIKNNNVIPPRNFNKQLYSGSNEREKEQLKEDDTLEFLGLTK